MMIVMKELCVTSPQQDMIPKAEAGVITQNAS